MKIKTDGVEREEARFVAESGPYPIGLAATRSRREQLLMSEGGDEVAGTALRDPIGDDWEPKLGKGR